VGIVATGRKPPALSQGKNAEEDEKRLAAVLRAGDPVIMIDNCERSIEGDFLCSMLTQEAVQTRILGKSRVIVLPTTSLVLATGNNLVLAGDMTRRAVMLRLDAGMERPDEREFDWDVRVEAMQQRQELAAAGLTILRAFHVAGRPASPKPFGSFDDWKFIRGALLWLDQPDPIETREQLLTGDPRRTELDELLSRWDSALGNEPTTLADLRKRVELQPSETLVQLQTFLIELSGKREWVGKSVGWKLRRHQDRPLAERVLRSQPTRMGQEWWVETVSENSDTPF